MTRTSEFTGGPCVMNRILKTTALLSMGSLFSKLLGNSTTTTTSATAEYKDNEIVDKSVSDKMGLNNIKTPTWMLPSAPIPSHCNNLIAEKITVPFEGSSDKWVYVIRNVLTKTECESLIKLSENSGYQDALVNIGGGYQQKISSVRNCKRVMIDNTEMTDHLWLRLSQFIPTIFKGRRKISFNERLRFLRYHKGEYFSPHFDGTYVRDNKEELSQMSVLIYLNDDYKGATTNFLDVKGSDRKYAPKITQGMALIFEHKIYHEGAELLKGVKYIIRTDVMFTYDEVEENENGIKDEYKPVDLMQKFMDNVREYDDEKMDNDSQGDGNEEDDEPMPKLFDIEDD